MDSKDIYFTKKVYTQRYRTTLKKDVFTMIDVANVNKVSVTLDANQLKKVVHQNDQNHSITNFIPRDVFEGSVELRENSSCSTLVGRLLR